MCTKKPSFEELVQQLHQFRQERRWLGLAPEDLAKSIMLEAAELLEHYQWDKTEFNRSGKVRDKNLDKISSEVADIFIYLLEFCQENNLDLLDITQSKMEHNAKKYPAEEIASGGSKAYHKAKEKYRRST